MSKPPDIYFLIGDCLRAANVRKQTMPFSNDVSDITASRCYSSGTWTLSSHASIYNISDPITHRQTQLNDELFRSQARLPKIAKQHGYRTSLFSENPTFGPARGFHHYIDYCDSDINYKLFATPFSPTEVTDSANFFALPQIAQEWVRRPNRLRNGLNLFYGFTHHFRNSKPNTYPHNGRRVIDHLVSYIKKTSDKKRPRLSFVNLLDPHNPHHAQPPSEGAEPLSIEVHPKESEALAAVNSQDVLLTSDTPPEEVTSEFPTWQAVYNRQEEIFEGQIRYTDWLLETFKSAVPDQFDDALVIITGDHGHLFYEEETVEHHSSLHPGAIHVPLFVSLPASWEQTSQTIKQPISLVDVARAVSKVLEQKCNDSNTFVAELMANDEVIVVADGPMWDVKSLRKKYHDDYVDTIAVRRVGIVVGDQMVEYTSPWNQDTVTRVKYEYSTDTRTIIDRPQTVDQLESERIETWLRDIGTSRVTTAATDRLQQLGYL